MAAHLENPDTLFHEVFSHLSQLQQTPSSRLNDDLLRRAGHAVDTSTPHATLWQLLQIGEALLSTITGDPQPLTRLLQRVVESIPFDELSSSLTPDKLIDGLKAPSNAIQLLCIAYLTRAASRPSGAAESAEVAERAQEGIVALLEVDSPESTTFASSIQSSGSSQAASRVASSGNAAQGQGLFSRRIFHDQACYVVFYRWTTLEAASNHDLSTKKGRSQVSISQARLLDFLPKVALFDVPSISTSTLPEIERPFLRRENAGTHAPGSPYGGLLKYAARYMIDKDDFLMVVLWKEFFEKLFAAIQESGTRRVPSKMLEAIAHDADGGREAGNDHPNGDGIHL
ncbi:uncharacterized protein AB675_5997 [Cyphellophora attinorum]|uniref:Uncharacterized protein n=1 Tax=Cyphellophora attinorum TaxID=1664694 RepID=A0A0N1H6H8_9EURO|nr:uncharacterized protein AB675_5997 [Phialophora attinorum]KPI36962.1 hypothetical protein AB675_5997 [Phialophora attinorum]